MAKRPDITELTSSYASQATLNANFSNIEVAFDNTLSLDGSTPNVMGADFDVNSNDILNVENIDVTSMTLGGVGVTAGDIVATPPASSITITDAAGHYVSGHVEGALSEVGQLTGTSSYMAALLEEVDETSFLLALNTTLENLSGANGAGQNIALNASGAGSTLVTESNISDMRDFLEVVHEKGQKVWIEDSPTFDSTSGTFTLNGLNSTLYDEYEIVITNLLGNNISAGNVQLTFSGRATGYNYHRSLTSGTTDDVVDNSGGTSSSAIGLGSTSDQGSGINGLSLRMRVTNPHSTSRNTQIDFVGSQSGPQSLQGAGEATPATDETSITFTLSTYNFAEGIVSLYGIHR